MSAPLLELEKVTVAGVSGPPLSLRVHEGECGVLCAGDAAEAALLAEAVLGLEKPSAGVVRLLGRDVGSLSERERLALLAQAGFVGAQGSLVENLKVWENLVLPAAYHGRLEKDADKVEAQVLEVLAAAGEGPEWAERLLSRTPDALDPRDMRVAGLIRAWLGVPRLIVAEMLFTDQTEESGSELADVLAWMMRRRPDLGVLCLHHGAADAQHLHLHQLPKVWIMNTKGEGHAVPQEH